MEVRRRPVASVGAGRAGDTSDVTPPGVELNDTTNELVAEGRRLYTEAEKSGFEDTTDLTNGLRRFLQAAVHGCDEAMEWIGSFLDSSAALPPSTIAALPPSLLHLLQWVQADTTTAEERKVYLVAEEMFQGMTPGARGIPKTLMDSAVAGLLSQGAQGSSPQLAKSAKGLKVAVKRLLFSALESYPDEEEVTMEMFCEAAVTYAKGALPHEDGVLTAEQQSEFKEANILKKVTKYPVTTAHFYKLSLLKLIERRGVKWIWSSFPTKQFCLLALAYFLPMLSPGFILASIATLVFLAAFIAMCVGTLQIAITAEKVSSFVEYVSVFQYFSRGVRKLNVKKPKNTLIRRSLLPCVTFGASFCLALLTFYLSHRHVVPNEVVCIISGFCALGIFLQFECYKSHVFLLCCLSRLLPWFSAFLTVFRDTLPIPGFLLYIESASVSIPLFLSGLAVRVNLLTLVQFPVHCAVVAYFLVRNKWHNVYSGLGPYLLFTSWLVMTRHFFLLSQPRYLFLGTFGVFFCLALSPFLPLLLVASPVIVLYYYGVSKVFFTYLGVIACFVVLLLVMGIFSRKLMETKWLNISFDSLVLIQILVSIPAILTVASWVVRYYTPVGVPVVTLAQYGEYCGPQNWAGGGGNMVQTQLDCLHLRDRVLMARGVVEKVKIEEIINDSEQGVGSLPAVLQVALTCLLGRLDPVCGSRTDMETCRREYTNCHFQHRHKFTFAVGLTLTLPAGDGRKLSAKLLSSNVFLDAVRDFNIGQTISFNATFVSGMGSESLVLQLVSLEGFKIGRSKELENIEDNLQLMAYQIMQAFLNTLTVLFDVLLGYIAPTY